MDKPILAMQLKNILIKPDPWDNAQKIWFQNVAKELKKPEIMGYINSENYFKYVEEIMIARMPKSTQEERIKKARQEYFKIVLDYIKNNKYLIIKENLEKLTKLKQEFKLGLITTNTKEAIHEILQLLGLNNFFDIIAFSNENEKEDSIEVAKRFMDAYGHPKEFIFREEDKLVEFLASQGVRCIKLNNI